MGNKPTIAISHLGCEKNRIDSEHMLGLLAKAGYPVDNDEELADYVIVNTCSFIQAAREESVRTLVELAEANKKIIISGCMAQHFQDELLTELPEAVAIVGTGDYQKIVEIVERVETGERVKEVSTDPTFIADENLPRYRTTTEGVAYLRVAEGCDYRCAFCIIPHLRGDQRSRSIESIVKEARQLASQGVQELIIEAIRESPNVLPYLDLPLQHSHPDILRAMNRPWQGRVNDGIIERIKQAIPNAVLRTTFIVGFPGETEEHFSHLLEFVKRHEFDHVGVFTFSAEEGTAAFDLPNPVPQAIMDERRERLMLTQQPISERKNQAYIGDTVDVLIEQENPETGELIGRSARFSPEVDGLVYVTGEAILGAIVQVRITSADTYDLYGEIV